MKLTIIAPTGGVGRQLLAQALDAHHDVTAVARNPAKLPPDVRATRDARGGRSVSRADVAHCMLAVLDQPETIGQVIGIAS